MSYPLWWQLRWPSWAITFKSNFIQYPSACQLVRYPPSNPVLRCVVLMVKLWEQWNLQEHPVLVRDVNSISRTIQCTFIAYLRCWEHVSHLTKVEVVSAFMYERACAYYLCICMCVESSACICPHLKTRHLSWLLSRHSLGLLQREYFHCVWRWMGSGCPQQVATPPSVKELLWPHGTTGWRPPR